MENTMKSADDMRNALYEKATVDPDFRSQLISDPKSAIKSELGVDFPDSMKIEVHDSGDDTLHIALPPAELTEDQLEAVAAGRCCCC